ncbi:Light regulated Lir1 [Dillenia turbinata]|uniref:Light regulated Lir1 n=1 Tax=Dillenia turbinata TaxID=194707 RepID=A0AAN8V746_9MAGN
MGSPRPACVVELLHHPFQGQKESLQKPYPVTNILAPYPFQLPNLWGSVSVYIEPEEPNLSSPSSEQSPLAEQKKEKENKMQGAATALCFAPSILSLSKPLPSKSFPAYPLKASSKLQTSLCPPIKAKASVDELLTTDYSSSTSVFPAEACETIGGEACAVEMYPEAKLKPEPRNNARRTGLEQVEREYLEYADLPKTVFPAEACDDLGGEFCEPSYQRGVY